ncbi:MAG: GDSL-type esterase/lipase family protein [Sediminibacterium sp.]|jgi:lysophospholipase L1-like esterase|nr:GDSL-type esterase/lipase family protein [Sediminibacterium sp.]
MKIAVKSILFSVLVFICTSTFAQPFINEIKAFRKADSITTPPKNAVLLIGSSSFTKWKDVQDYFPAHTMLNRGFGGSSLTDVIYYVNDVILKYKPKQILIYCGENDIAGSTSVTADTVFERFKILYTIIRSKFKKVPIGFISMKPSPSREKYLETMQKGNAMIKSFMEHEKRSSYIDVYSSMLDANGKILTHIFLSDKLHMNAEGYKIWQGVIAPYLVK